MLRISSATIFYCQRKMQKIMDEDRFSSPSFNSCYSSDALAKIADKTSSDDRQFQPPPPPPVGSVMAEHSQKEEEDDDDDDDFEFSFVPENFDAFPGGFVYDGQIGSVFPVFNRDLLLDEGFRDPDRGDEGKALPESSVGISSLKNLFLEGQPQSSSSSDADELDCVPPGTYCVWRPKKIDESSSSLGKKSSSTGSTSMPRRIRDLLCRANSHGNDRYVFLTPKTGETSKAAHRSAVVLEVAGKTQIKKKKKSTSAAAPPMAAHEAFYLRSKAAKEGEKRKSYLPYRRELVGFFANVKPAAFGKI